MDRRDHFDAGHGKPEHSRMPLDPDFYDDDGSLSEGMRECDTCGRTEDAGSWPDWINGSCENCDPWILEHPDNDRPEGVSPNALNMGAVQKGIRPDAGRSGRFNLN